MTVTEARNLAASLVGAGTSVHSAAPSASLTRPACNMDRRMVAVTIALSEPAGSPVLPALVAGKRVTLCANHSRPEWAEYARNYFGGENAA